MLDVIHDRATQCTDKGKTELIRGGSAYFSLLIRLINSAEHHIHLQSYIFDDDETGTMVADALKAAVKKGVKVYLLVDGYASRNLSSVFISELKDAGIYLKFFEPLFRSSHFYVGRRLHHKLFVADAVYALVGGINVSNRYNDISGHAAWLDFALYIEGDLSKEICVLCWKTWYSFPKRMGLTPCETEVILPKQGNIRLRIRRNDWVRRKNEISTSYAAMLANAEKSITIFSSYFLPGKTVRRLLSAAARRGVVIQIVTAGHSDVLLSKYAERWLYDWLLRNNIKVYEYQASVLHAKMAVCDSKWFTIGSYNLNNISMYTAVELNVEVNNAAFAQEVETVMHSIIDTECVSFTKDRLLCITTIFEQFERWLAYETIRIIFFVVTFYYRKWN